MLLRQLLAAIARRQARKAPEPERKVEPTAYGGTVASQTRLPKEPALAAIYGPEDEALEAFLELPPSEQISAIEAELEKLPDHEKQLIIELLQKELSRKWIPQPGPQTQALRSEAHMVLYGGSAGGGKTDLLLGLALTEHKRSMIVRREYDDLSFITERAVKINKTRAGFAQSPHPVLRTEDGRLVEFRAFQRAGDEQKRQGQPVDFLGVDEAAQFLESQVKFLFGWLRSTEEGQRRRVVLASNPPLADEGQWLVRWFAPWLDPQHPKPAKPGELRWFLTDEKGEDKEVDGEGPHPVGNRMVKARSRTFIPARLQDNAYLMRDDDYVTQLDNLHEPLRSAMRDGNFMAVRQDDAFQVIPSEWIRLAQARWTPTPPTPTMTCISLDPAGGGRDAAAIAYRHGLWFGPVIAQKGPQTADGRYMGARVLMERKNACQVVVDMGGGYGFEVVNVLKDNQDDKVAGRAVHGFRGSDASTGKAVGSGLEFKNMRAEVWWRFREALDPSNLDKIALPPDSELAADLATPRINARVLQKDGVLQIESKEDIRQRLGRSPDKGDAVVNCLPFGGLLLFERKANPRLPTTATVGYAAQKKYSVAGRR
jgi:hypothetical protein